MPDEATTEREVVTPSSEPSQEKRGPGRPSKSEARVAELESQLDEMKALIAQVVANQHTPPAAGNAPLEQEVVPWGEDGRYTYSCESKDCTIIHKRDMKAVINGEVVFQPAKAINFQEGWFVTEDPAERDFIESLPEFKKGKPYRIARGAELRPRAISVSDGPRTSLPPATPMRTTPRPAGALSAPLT